MADLEELNILDVSEIRDRRINTKEVLMTKSGKELVFPFAYGSVKLAGREQVFRKSTLIQDHPARREDHYNVLRGESDGSQPPDHQADDVEA